MVPRFRVAVARQAAITFPFLVLVLAQLALPRVSTATFLPPVYLTE